MFNLNFVIVCLQDLQFCEIVLQSNLLVIDGMFIVWIVCVLGLFFIECVFGLILFDVLCSMVGWDGVDFMCIYFFGGLFGVVKLVCEKINVDCSGMQVVGYEILGFGMVEEMSSFEIIVVINQSGVDFFVVVLVVCKGQ